MEEEKNEDVIPTGISGLDQMLFGGISKYNQVIIAGGPGTGKTLLSFEIAYNCAKQGINSAFITLEESPTDILKNAKKTFKNFTDIDEIVASKKLIVSGYDAATKLQESTDSELYTFGNVVADIENTISLNNAQLVVIDSISLLKLILSDETKYRKAVFAMVSNLKRLRVTSLIISEISFAERKDIRFTPEFFIFDSVIVMYPQSEEDKRTLSLEIVKTRGSNHSWALAPYEILPNGFRVFTIED
ncbi:MAG: ATPase domain-containing protein [Candidatus Micrarchaeaceae archaeon]